MSVSVRSFAKINLGLAIGKLRPDRFHALETIYQTVAAYDVIRVDAARGTGIEIRCKNPKVPCDESNTCYRVADRMLRHWKRRVKVVITIEKNLPVQGGLGAGSSNAVAAMFALEREMGEELGAATRLQIAAEVGSDLPLFLLGGCVLGMGRGEQVYPLPDLPAVACLLVTPAVAVSTPQAFRDWDELVKNEEKLEASPLRVGNLTCPERSDTLSRFHRSAFEWLSNLDLDGIGAQSRGAKNLEVSGVPAKGGDRAGNPLLDLVRAGIENDFERVVFPQYPELREVKRALEREGAAYASLSGSGSTLYGLFGSREQALEAAGRIGAEGLATTVTETLPRECYREQMFVS
jgi:4-diphosphocytidyl-2-C-methyl-D-erythritol kinase